MTSRERVKKAINWQKPDRIPFHEDFWEDTFTQWREQGLPENVLQYPVHEGKEKMTFPEEYFNMDIQKMFLDSSPRFPMEILSQEGEFYTFTDRYGYTAKKTWKKSGSIHFIDTVTKDRDAWDKIVKPRWKMTDDEPARIDDTNYFEHFAPYPNWQEALRRFQYHHQAGRYMLAFNYGPWEATWRHRDFTNLLMDIALTPDWVAEMAEKQLEITLQILEKSISEGILPDGYMMVDDLGSSNGPLMSPQMWSDVLQPSVKKLGNFLAKHNIDFWMHSCGNAEAIYPKLIDCGVKVMNPLQVTAGLDAVDLKEKYKGSLAFYGNINAHILDGPWEILEKEIQKRKDAFSDGGYIFHSDHSVPPTMSLKQFQQMMELIKS